MRASIAAPQARLMKPISLNDFRAQWSLHQDDVLAAVRRVGESGWWILGAEVEAFERELALFWGLPHCTGCASGLDAIELALRACELRPGERVLTTPLSAFATSLAIVRAGGVPVFVDVDSSGQIDLDLCEEAFAADASLRTLVPVHLYGHALDLDRLEALRERFSLRIVEDCAQAVGASSRGRAVGSVGVFAATSFYPTKNLGAMGDGGAVLSGDAAGDARIRKLRDYGQSGKFVHTELGLNSRLDELQAAILRQAFLPELERATKRRREIASGYLSQIENDALLSPVCPEGCESVWHLFPLRVASASERDAFRAHLDAAGIASGVHYPKLISEQDALAPWRGENVIGKLDCARAFTESEVSIPIHPFMSDADVARVVAACNTWRPSSAALGTGV